MLNYRESKNRQEWLELRQKTIGASDAAIVMGIASFKTPNQLWLEKMGKEQPEDLSENKRVEYGTFAESHLRELFALQFNEKYKVKYNAYRIYTNDEIEGMSCTLDGELFDLESEELGIWECKTTWITSKRDEEEWKDRIPDKYYIQVLAQLAVTGWEFVVLTAQLIFQDGHSEIRHYTIKREEVEEDIKIVIEECKKFYQMLKTGKQPDVKINL